jgi:hypothetical protein
MIRKENDGKYTVKCGICSWNTVEMSEIEAKGSLARHMDLKHREESIHIAKKDQTVPASGLPPNLPAPIAPGGGRRKRRSTRT